jgi:hypothetical protein
MIPGTAASIAAPLLDLVEVAPVGVVGRRSLRGTNRRASQRAALGTLSKRTPNWLACQLEVISNLHRVRIITDQKAAVVL